MLQNFLCNPDITYLFLSRNFCRFSSGSSPPLDDEGLLAGAMLAGRVAGASGDVLLTSEINTWWRIYLFFNLSDDYTPNY